MDAKAAVPWSSLLNSQPLTWISSLVRVGKRSCPSQVRELVLRLSEETKRGCFGKGQCIKREAVVYPMEKSIYSDAMETFGEMLTTC